MSPIVQTVDWHEFKQHLSRYSVLSPRRRKQFIFRGHAKTSWRLEASIDRIVNFDNESKREAVISNLIREFQRESLAFAKEPDRPGDRAEWEFLGRHHGLYSPILDWTDSPFMAAFFAFEEAKMDQDKLVSVWVLDRDEFLNLEAPDVRLMDDDWMIRMNPRAIEQQALFIRVGGVGKPLEYQLDAALTRFDMPPADRDVALADLDEMNINTRSLFRNLDGAARLANRRAIGQG